MNCRYFVTHFKSCHLKNLLYRFNGHSEEENSRVRFGPRRKKDANNWFGQLKSTEKRMVSNRRFTALDTKPAG